MMDTKIKAALVSTNSITQGQQVAPMWKPLLLDFGLKIIFAYQSFKWNSEAKNKAAVHCVIIGFSCIDKENKKLFKNQSSFKLVENINGYLMDAPDIFVEKRSKPLSKVPEMSRGFEEAGHGFLILSKEEKKNFIKKDPRTEKWIRKFSMGREFINNIDRYCLWLKGISPKDLNSIPLIKERVRLCKEWRESQTRTGGAYKLKDTPHLFKPCSKFKDKIYISFPRVSSSARKYIPLGFVDDNMIPGDKLYFINSSSLSLFGTLHSNVHMAWMKYFAGRLKSDYSYGNTTVYNTFPFPDFGEKDKENIERTAQGILDARSLYPDSSLADLYDELTMPIELRKAHRENDKAVMKAYGFDWKNMTEAECVRELMALYEKRIQEEKEKDKK